MAKLKMLKLPKKPKQSASNATKESYLKKVAEIKKENQRRKSANDYGKRLSEKIAQVSGSSVMPGSGGSGRSFGPKKRKSSSKKKAAKKSSRRKKR